MTKTGIKDMILARTPFTKSELTEPVNDEAIRMALVDLNKYRPQIVSTYDNLLVHADYKDKNPRILRTQLSAFSDFAEEDASLLVDSPDVIGYNKYAINWDLLSLDTEATDRDYFERLVIIHASMMMSNPRRTTGMSAIPFELNGSAFYEEYKADYRELLLEIQDTMNNTL